MTEKQVSYLSFRFREMEKWFSKVERKGLQGNYIYIELETFIRKLNKYEYQTMLDMLNKEEYGSLKELMLSKGFKHFV